jgi:alpha-mannosidase
LVNANLVNAKKERGDSMYLHVISHTHWDREWYETFDAFRFRLVEFMDHLLSILTCRPEYHSFTLDGQTVILEDYLEIRPEKRGELKKTCPGWQALHRSLVYSAG